MINEENRLKMSLSFPQHAKISKGYLAIEEKHDKLLTSLRTAYAEELNLKKEQTSFKNIFLLINSDLAQ